MSQFYDMDFIFLLITWQFNTQNSPSQVGPGVGVQALGLGNVSTTSKQQPSSIHQPSNQQALSSSGPKDAGTFSFLVCITFKLNIPYP